jgi:acyl-CoA thioester hydrolase
MGRVKLVFPADNPLFETTIYVRIGDINYGGHVGNDAILSIIHESRMRLLHSFGFTEMEAGGVGLIMADVMIAYKGEAFYGDILTVRLYANEFSAHSFDLMYRISTERNAVKTDIAHAKTGMACFNYNTRKIVPFSNVLAEKLGKPEED